MPGSTTRRVFATVKLGANGVRFTIEETQQFQANALLTKDMFRVFELDDGVEPMFKIAFDTLLDVLGIFSGSGGGGHSGAHGGGAHGGGGGGGGAHSGMPVGGGGGEMFSGSAAGGVGRVAAAGLRMAYSSRMSDNLMVVLTSGEARNLVETTCSLRTLECEMPMNISDLLHQKKLNQLIISAPALREAFNELDWSSSWVELLLSPDEPYFRLSTGSKTGSCEVSFAKGSDTISSFAVTEHQAARYSLAYLTPAAKGLHIATTASIKTNRDGLLLIQMAIDVGGGGVAAGAPNLVVDGAAPAAFVDFYVVPLVDDLEGEPSADGQDNNGDDDNDDAHER